MPSPTPCFCHTQLTHRHCLHLFATEKYTEAIKPIFFSSYTMPYSEPIVAFIGCGKSFSPSIEATDG